MKVLLDVLYTVVTTIFKVSLPIIIVLSIGIIIKIICRYRKYGSLEFDVFRKREQTKFSDIIFSMLDKIDSYKKVIKNNNLYCDIVLIAENGVYLIKLMKYQGFVSGKRNALKISNKITNTYINNIDNPFYYLDKDKKKINELNNDLVIKTVLVVNNTVQININNVLKEEVILLKNFFFSMENVLKKNKIYDKAKIDEINQIIDKI